MLEIAIVPLALGLPLFALGFFIANAVLVAWRIHVENRALAWAARAGRGAEALSGVTLANGSLRR